MSKVVSPLNDTQITNTKLHDNEQALENQIIAIRQKGCKVNDTRVIC